MGSAERRERERQKVRKKILDAARSLFAAHGYDAVTMRKIAGKIEYSPTAIYLHFKDKDELIQELCGSDFLAFSERFADVAALSDPVEQLKAAARIYVQFGLEHPNHYRLMFMTPIPVKPPTEAKERKGNPKVDAYAFLRLLVAQSMEKRILRPELKDTDLVAQTIWAGLHGVIALEIAMTKNRDEWIDWRPIQQRVDLAMDVLIRGMSGLSVDHHHHGRR